MVDCCTWRHFLKIVIQDHFFLREHPFYNLSSWIAFSVYANYRVSLVHQNYLLQIQVLRSIINLKLINPCNVSSVVYTPLPDWFQSVVYVHNFVGSIGHNLFSYHFFYFYLCVIFILLYAHNFGGNIGHNLFIYGKIALHLLFGWSLDKDKKKFGSIQTILMKVWIDPN